MNDDNDQRGGGTRRKAALSLEQKIGKAFIEVRWLQLPLLVGLVAGLILFEISFFNHLIAEIAGFDSRARKEVILLALDMVDMVLIANLMVMVIISGYKIFISHVELERHRGLPDWLAGLTLAGVKYRISATVLLIATIHLLHELLDTQIKTVEGGLLILGVQIIFVVTTFTFATIERWERE